MTASEFEAQMSVRCEGTVWTNEARAFVGELLDHLGAAEARVREVEGAFRALMSDSRGVAGLHLNGDLATWDWLQENGWIPSFAPENNAALARSVLSAQPAPGPGERTGDRRCPEGCRGIEIEPGVGSGCECLGERCDCPNHPET